MADTILIIDAEKAARKELELVLAKEEFQVFASGDYDAALSILGREEIAVLIADLQLHGGNGWKVALEQMNEHPAMVVFATSQNVDLKLGRAMIKRGVREILYKPYSAQMLAKKINFAMRTRGGRAVADAK